MKDSLAAKTSLFDYVSDMQERMEDNGFNSEVVDVIVSRGLEILLGLSDESEG